MMGALRRGGAGRVRCSRVRWKEEHLRIHGWIPVAVVEYHCVCARQVHAHACTRKSRQSDNAAMV